MENPEDLLNKVLAGLREAEIPAGLEVRILNTVQARLRRPDTLGWRGYLHLWTPASLRSVAVAMVVCAAISVGLLGVFVHLRHAEPATERIDAALQAQLSGHPGSPLRSALPMRSAPRALSAQLRKSPTIAHRQEVIERVVSAASHPAPPLPLTNQERLLVDVARQRNKAALLLLSQDAQSVQLARADEQFQRFFAPPPAMPTPQEDKAATAGPGGAL